MQRSIEWLEARQTYYVTASEFATALGHNRYRSRGDLLRVKTGLQKPFSGNAYTRFGERWEGYALSRYSIEQYKPLLYYGCVSKTGYPEFGGSPDAVTADGILIEVKCPVRRQIVPGEVPEHYVDQIQGLMWLMDLSRCHFVQYDHRTDTLDITEVARDDSWPSRNLPALYRFVEDVRHITTLLAVQTAAYRRCVLKLLCTELRTGRAPTPNDLAVLATLRAQHRAEIDTVLAAKRAARRTPHRSRDCMLPPRYYFVVH